MRRLLLIVCSASVLAGLANPARAAATEVCVVVDDAHDMLSPQDRVAALQLVGRQFELNGVDVTQTDCPESYTLSHIRLGDTITVMLSGPEGRREGVARGMENLPLLYGQMVRSIVTGRPMNGRPVVGQEPVAPLQASPRQVEADSFGYARVGYGGIFGKDASGTPSFGFGYRAELDRFALDMSFLNFQLNTSGNGDTSSSAGSLVKIEALRFMNTVGNSTGYYGGGVSWGWTNFSRYNDGPGTYSYSDGHGSGLAGELTAGFELGRSTTLRLFVQADATLPLYQVTWESLSRSGLATSRRYTPSAVVSLGVGWQRGRR